MEAFARMKQGVKGALQLIPGRRMVWRGPGDLRRAALTFDDGPGDLTPACLDLLDRYGVPATFFVRGDIIEQRPGAIAEYLRRGHQIGCHGYDHQKFTALSLGDLRAQLARTTRAIGPVPQRRLWVRPPYGAIGVRALAMMLAAGHVVAMWSLDSGDCCQTDPAALVARCAPEQIAPGEVLLFHENYAWTLAALPAVIEGLQGAGYELVTMADLVTP